MRNVGSTNQIAVSSEYHVFKMHTLFFNHRSSKSTAIVPALPCSGKWYSEDNFYGII